MNISSESMSSPKAKRRGVMRPYMEKNHDKHEDEVQGALLTS